MIDKYIEQLLEKSSPEKPYWNQEMILQGKKAHWNYIDGCMMTAFLNLYDKTGEDRYLTFVDNFIGYFVEDNGNIKTYEIGDLNLDNINQGRSLFKLYEYTGKEKYKKAIEFVYNQIKIQPRTSQGNFWHKKIYPNQVWLDGLYMSMPFYLEYEKKFNNKKNYPDILSQILNVVNVMKDKKTGLYYHAYDCSKESFWSDNQTGLSQNFWLRATGWYVMALVDVLEILEESDTDMMREITNVFKDFIDSLLKYQDKSGMWFQVPDRAGEKDNYLETSGSAILSYAILKAVNLGILPETYKVYGINAFNGIKEKYLKIDGDSMVLGGTCLVAGLGGKDRRDGSYEYYMSEPVVENEAKGIAPFILAYLYI